MQPAEQKPQADDAFCPPGRYRQVRDDRKRSEIMQVSPLKAEGLSLSDPHPGGKATIFGVQALRFIAAALVVVTHAINREITLYSNPPLHKQDWMQAGVDIFFVISGFIMVYIIKPETQAGPFWLQRFTRIVPLYWVATAVAFFGCLWAPDWFFGHQGAWFAIRSALFIPTGDNSWAHPILSPGWTLVYEFAFYTILAVCLALRRPPFATAVVVIVAIVSIGMMLKPWLPFMGFYADEALMLEFLFGMGAAVLVRHHSLKPWQGLAIAAIGLTLIYFLWTYKLNWPRGIKIGLPAFLTVFGFLVSEPLWQKYNPLRQFARLGDASYSIYLVHFFVVTALAVLFKRNAALHDAFGPVGYTLTAIVLGIGAGILAHLFIEKPLLKLVRGFVLRGRTSGLVPAAAKV